MGVYELPDIPADSWQAAPCVHCSHPLGHHGPTGWCLAEVDHGTFSTNCKCPGYETRMNEHPDGWRIGDRVEVAGQAARRGRPSKHTWATGHIVGFGIQNPDIARVEADCPMRHDVKSFLSNVSNFTRIDEFGS